MREKLEYFHFSYPCVGCGAVLHRSHFPQMTLVYSDLTSDIFQSLEDSCYTCQKKEDSGGLVNEDFLDLR